MKKVIVFDIDKSKVLNANEKKHHFVHSKIASFLRTLGAEKGIELHETEEARKLAGRHRDAVNSEKVWTLQKKRARGDLKKKSKGMTEKAVREQVDLEYADLRPAELPMDVPAQHVFQKFKVTVVVSPPSKRRLDPPNLYPTIKPLIDGMTDVALWPDDSFDYSLEMSFRYGKPTGTAGLFRIYLILEDADPVDYEDLDTLLAE